MPDINEQEKSAIRKLKKLAKTWPKSLWLYSASGRLNVMRYGTDGKCVVTERGSVCPSASVVEIDIDNDGGDW